MSTKATSVFTEMVSLIVRPCCLREDWGAWPTAPHSNQSLVKASPPGPYSAEHLVSLNSKSKEQRNIKRHEQLRRKLTVEIFLF